MDTVINATLNFTVKLTAKNIREFIQQKIASQTIGWLTSRALNNAFGEGKTSVPKHIIQTLEEIHNGMKNTEESFEKLAEEMKWEQLDSRIFSAETNICHRFLLLKSILTIQNEKERTDAINMLKNGILDINNGVFRDMYVIHKVLLGETFTSPAEKGLIQMWFEKFQNNMIKHPKSAVTVAYHKHAMHYFNKFSTLQLQGFILLWGACSSSQFYTKQLDTIWNNLSSQQNLVDEFIPAALIHLTNPCEGRLFVLRASNNNVIYGCPRSVINRQGLRETLYMAFSIQLGLSFELKKHKLILRERTANNEDEEWIFMKSSTFSVDGSLCIRKNPGKNSANHNQYIEVVNDLPYWEQTAEKATKFFVMPLHTTDKSMKVCICTCNKRFLQYSANTLTFTDNRYNIEFTMTQTEHPNYTLDQ